MGSEVRTHHWLCGVVATVSPEMAGYIDMVPIACFPTHEVLFSPVSWMDAFRHTHTHTYTHIHTPRIGPHIVLALSAFPHRLIASTVA